MTSLTTGDSLNNQHDDPGVSEEQVIVASSEGASTTGSQTSELDDPAQPSYSVTNERWKTLETIRELEAKVLLEEERQRAIDNDDLDGPTIRSGTRSTALPKFRTKEEAAAALHLLEQQILEDKAGITGPRKYLECLERSIVQEKGVPPQLASQISWRRPQQQQQQQRQVYQSTTNAWPSGQGPMQDKTSQARAVVAQLESSPAVPSLVAQEARAALSLLESRTQSAATSREVADVPSPQQPVVSAAAERALQQLEAKATGKNSTNKTTNNTPIVRNEAVQALEELETKAVGLDLVPQQHSTTAAAAHDEMQRNLTKLESKFTVTGGDQEATTSSSSAGVPVPSAQQHLRSSLYQLESKFDVVTAGERPITPSSAQQQQQQLRSSLDQLGSKLDVVGGSSPLPAQQQLRSSLNQLESKFDAVVPMNRKAQIPAPTTAQEHLRSSLQQLESKFDVSGEAPPSAQQHLRSSLNQLESKFDAVAVPGQEGTLPAAGAVIPSQDQLRNALTQLESKFDTASPSGPQKSSTKDTLRSSLNQLESKFSAEECTAASLLQRHQQQLESKDAPVRVGAVAVGPTSNLDTYEQRLEAKLSAKPGAAGTATAVNRSGHVSQEAQQALRNMQAKVAAEGDGKGVVRLDPQGRSIATSEMSEAVATRRNLQQIETKLLETNIGENPRRASNVLPAQGTATDSASQHQASLRNFGAVEPGATQEENMAERVERKLLQNDGSTGRTTENSGYNELEEAIASRMFAASRRGDGNVGAFPNTPEDALRGHGPRNPLRVSRQTAATTSHPEQSGIAQSSETTEPVQVDIGKDLKKTSWHDIDTQEQGLVKAIEVNEEAIKAVPLSADEEKEQEERNQKFNTWVRRHAAALSIVLVVVVAIVVVVLVTTKDNSSDDDLTAAAPTASPTPAPTAFAISSLPAFTLEALEDPDSPQSLAYQWLRADPKLEKHSEERRAQRMALATLYYATNGNKWTVNTDWLSYDVDECFWFSKYNITSGEHAFKPPGLHFYTTPEQLTGVPICDDDGNYLALVLTQNELSGTLPQEVSMLINLELLALASNSELAGSMATGIGLLTNMKELDFGNTRLTGSIPSEIGLMTHLEYLILREVPISGTLPTEIGSIASMKEMEVMRTHVTGTIPLEYYDLKNITYFGLFRNKLTGTVPTEISQLSDTVEIFRVDDNHLSGTIPTEVGLLTKMTILNLRENGLTGSIPTELGNLEGLEQLWLEHNILTSTIPSVLGTLSNNTLATFADLLITGTVPLSIWLLPKSFGPDISRNPFLEGSIPTEIGIANKFIALFAYEMGPKWGGPIPSEIGLQTNLLWASLDYAKLEGSIPTEIADIVTLQDLTLEGNPLLTGTLPEAIGKLPRLENVSFAGTQLTGPLPDEICSIDTLKFDCEQMCGCHCPCTNETLQLEDMRTSQQHLR